MNDKGPIKVMVVDDHPMWRDAVARDLAESGFDVVATAGDGDQAVRRARAAGPDVLVLDLNLPVKPGVQVCKEARRAQPGAACPRAVGERRARRRPGGREVGRDRLSAEVRLDRGTPGRGPPHGRRRPRLHARSHAASCSASTAASPPTPRPCGGPDQPRAPQLTERETEVLRLVAKGLSYKQIAERLVISHRTVQNHVQNTLGKLQLHNRVELVRYAIERGLDDE